MLSRAFVRPDMLASLDAYVVDGVPPCTFLRYLLENNACDAAGAADSDNQRAFLALIAYVYNDVPSICWGSPHVVQAWLAFKQAERSGVDGQDLQAFADEVSDAKCQAEQWRIGATARKLRGV